MKLLLAISLVLLMTAPVSAQTFQDAMDHFNNGDYRSAAQTFRRLSEVESNAAAMNNLGVLFQNGLGVPRDEGKAMYWYERANRNGDELAPANIFRLQQIIKERRRKSL